MRCALLEWEDNGPRECRVREKRACAVAKHIAKRGGVVRITYPEGDTQEVSPADLTSADCAL